MSRYGLVFVALAGGLLLVACGGSSTHSSTTTAATAATATTTSAPVATSTSTGAGGTATSTATTTSTSATSAGSQTTTSAKPPPTNAHIPVIFTIRPSGVLPATISVPGKLPIELTVVSADGKVHHVVLRTITPYPLTVQASGHASVRIPGQRNGTYALDVDGARKASLVVGANPGP